MSHLPTPPIIIQERDFELLRGLFECRVMTALHVAVLYFDGKREYAKKRLQKLKAAGLIAERARRVNEPSVLFLTRKGFTALNNEGALAEFPPLSVNSFEVRAEVKTQTLRHELEIMDVKAALQAALSKSAQFSLLKFSTWPKLHQFEVSGTGFAARVPVKPDGFIRIHEMEAGTKGFVHDCFFELDRSTETLNTLVSKCASYIEYYRSGGFALRNGAERNAFKEFPFRVLIVVKSEERRNNIALRLAELNPPILTQVWLTTFREVMADPLGIIWIRPVDCRAAVQDTSFCNRRQDRNFEYVSQPERETLVGSRIKKLTLVEG